MLIWSFKKITELNNRTGLIACDDALAKKLIEDGHAQNPNVGGNHLKPIQNSESASAYEVAIKAKVTKKRKAAEEGDK